MSNSKMTMPAFNWDLNKQQIMETPDMVDSEIPFTESADKHFGMPITVDAFHKLLFDFVKNYADEKPFDIQYVEFSKASIFRILSQPGCEFIRFYFAFPEKDKLSLVLEGLDKDQTPIKYNPNVLRISAPDQQRVADVTDPHYEERGNRVSGTDNVKSVFAAIEQTVKNENLNLKEDHKNEITNPQLLQKIVNTINLR